MKVMWWADFTAVQPGADSAPTGAAVVAFETGKSAHLPFAGGFVATIAG
jgi:hypothetical protein